MDGLSAEREQGITIDVAYRYFSTPKRSFIVADTPGHEQYTRNMATGASTADLAILLVDARKGLLPQTRRHAFIASMLRVPHVVLAVNKMDMVGHDQAEFDKIVQEFTRVSAGLGFASITAIPLSARYGDNVVQRSPSMPWYSGSSLLAHLETIDLSGSDALAQEFVLPVQWVNRPDASFRGFSGTIASGVIASGDRIRVQPGGAVSTVRRIVSADGDLDRAQAGQAVTLELTEEIDISRGNALVGEHAQSLRVAVRATAHVFWTGAMPGSDNQTYLVQIAGAQTQVRLARIHHAVDMSTYAPVAAEKIAMNGVAAVTLEFEQGLPLADYNTIRALGSFLLVDRYSNETVAIGLVEQDLEADLAEPAFSAGRGNLAGIARLRFERLAGVGGSAKRQDFLHRASWRLTSGFVVGVLAGGISGSVGIALCAGAADLLVRPLMRRWHRAIWLAGRDGEPLHRDGGGI